MSAEELKAKISHAMDEAYNKGNLQLVDDTVAPNLVYHNRPFPDVLGCDGYKQYIAGLRAAYSDLHITFDEIIGEGNTTVARWTLRGVHTGQSPSVRIPPTGKQVTLTGCLFSHWENGRVIEHWNHVDYLGMLQQLGIFPPPGKSG